MKSPRINDSVIIAGKRNLLICLLSCINRWIGMEHENELKFHLVSSADVIGSEVECHLDQQEPSSLRNVRNVLIRVYDTLSLIWEIERTGCFARTGVIVQF